MKKNFSVNIGNRLFNIDEDAFECLNSYLARLRNYFSASEGYEEILADIEMRIAELLDQQVAQGQSLIVLEDIRGVIAGMGEPDQLSDSDESNPKTSAHARTSGKLYRDPVNRQVGGVAAGLAAFFGIDPVWVRLIFVISTLLYGSGPIIYIVLWLILPEAQTTSEKLQMQRQTINIGTLRDELALAGSGIKKTSSSFLEFSGEFLRSSVEIVARLTAWFFRLFGRLAGLMLLGLVLLSFLGLSLALLVREDIGTGGYQFDSITMFQVFKWMVPGTADQWLFYIAFVLLLVAVSGLLIYGGLRLLLKWPPLRWPVIIAFLMMLLAGIFTAGSAIFRYSESTDYSDTVIEYNSVTMPVQRLHLLSGPWDAGKFLLPLSGNPPHNAGSGVLGEIQLSFRPAPGDSLIITLIRKASSVSQSLSEKLASHISYHWEIKDTLLTINPYFSMPFDDGMHYQELNVIIGIPVNKEIYLDPEISWKARYSDFIDTNNDGGLYTMTVSGLTKRKPEVTPADSVAVAD